MEYAEKVKRINRATQDPKARASLMELIEHPVVEVKPPRVDPVDVPKKVVKKKAAKKKVAKKVRK